MSSEATTEALQKIYGTPEPEPIIKVMETRRPKVLLTSRDNI